MSTQGVTMITGASSGLGEGMSRELANRGHDLVLFARRIDRLTEIATEIEHQSSSSVDVRTLDVNDHTAVFDEFQAASDRHGYISRVVVNAGIGKGGRIGAGRFTANRDTLMTNVVGALAQIEAAMELFYSQGAGHLVVMSSVTSGRGLPGPMNAYAAGKAALTQIAAGIRLDVAAKQLPIKVTTLRPGYIESEMQDRTGRKHPLLVDAQTGARALADAIDRGKAEECVPRWPWTAYSALVNHAPRRLLNRLL